MNTGQIKTLLSRHMDCRSVFVDVLAADQLPPVPQAKRPCCYIVNTQNAAKQGEHWVVCCFNKESMPNEYFDSYGRAPIQLSIKKFLGKRYVYNNVMLQTPLSTVCGQYAVMYVLMKSRGHTTKAIIKRFNKGGSVPWINDELVVGMVKKEFGISLPVFDELFLNRKMW